MTSMHQYSIIKGGFAFLGFDVFNAIGQLIPVVDAGRLLVVQPGGYGDHQVEDERLDRLVAQEELLDIDLCLSVVDEQVGRKGNVHLRTEKSRGVLAPGV